MPTSKIIGQYSNLGKDSIEIAAPLLQNCYSTDMDTVAKRPGLLNEFNLPQSSPVTGIHVWDAANQVIITLADGSIYRKDVGGLTLLTGAIRNGGFQSIAAMNSSKMWIASGGPLIQISATTTAGGAAYLQSGLMSTTGLAPFTTITSTPPTSVTHVILFDNYLLCNDGRDPQIVWFSQAFLPTQTPVFFDDSVAGTTGWVTVDYRPDAVSAIALFKNQVVMFGLDSLESWYNSSVAGFPFLRIDNSQSDVGLIAPYSVVTVGDAVYFLARDRKIWSIPAPSDKRGLSGDIQRDLDNLTVANDCVASTINDNGQTFVVFNFPTDQKTFVMNVSNGRWSQWRYSTGSAMRFNTSAYVRDISFGSNNTTNTATTPSAVSTVINGTSTDWTNPTNIQGAYGPEGATHRTNSAAASQSYFLRALGFGLAIPLESTIKGVRVTIKFLDSSVNAECFGETVPGNLDGWPGEAWDDSRTFTAQTMRLVLNGALLASKTVTDVLNDSDALSWGGPTDLWGLTTIDYLTLNSALFGLDFSFSSSGAPSGSGVVVSAIILEVTYLNANALSTVGATWVGDSTTGAIHSLSSTQYSDEVVAGTKVPIDVEIESGTITYKSLKTKFVSNFDVRCQTDSGLISLSMHDDSKPYTTPLKLKLGEGIARSGQLGSYRSRRYKIQHNLDKPFVFVEGEEDATLGNS